MWALNWPMTGSNGLQMCSNYFLWFGLQRNWMQHVLKSLAHMKIKLHCDVLCRQQNAFETRKRLKNTPPEVSNGLSSSCTLIPCSKGSYRRYPSASISVVIFSLKKKFNKSWNRERIFIRTYIYIFTDNHKLLIYLILATSYCFTKNTFLLSLQTSEPLFCVFSISSICRNRVRLNKWTKNSLSMFFFYCDEVKTPINSPSQIISFNNGFPSLVTLNCML